MAFYRFPSPIELSYIAEDTPTFSPFVNQYCVEGVGDLSVADLQAAMNKVAASIPELRLVMRGFLKWRYWDDAGPLPRVYSVDAAGWDGKSSDGAPVSGSPMDVRKGPLFEAVFLEGTPRRILFRSHHACTDGMGMLYIMECIFKELRGEPFVLPSSRKTDWDVVLQEGHVEKQVKLNNAKPVFRNLQAPTELGYHWKRIHFKGSGSGITGKVMSVLADMADAASHDHDGRFLIRVPADLRRYLPKGEFTAANCTSALDLEPGEVRGAKKMQALLIQSMRNKQDLGLINERFKWAFWLPLALMRPSEKARLANLARNRFLYSVTVTNMGEVPLERYSCPRFVCNSAFGIPIPLRTPMTVAFFLDKDGVWFSIGMPSAVGTRADLDRVADEIVARLGAI
ncbi:Hypothetical protein HDN1F_15310 [gamma proteobacterium HdN1]|nr:Hypothetical protein HDN1F_15310 [gamma proteobacterium HdN1]